MNISIISHENLNRGKFYDDYKYIDRTSEVAVLAKNINLAFNPKMEGRVTNKFNYSYSAHKYDSMTKINKNDVTPLEPKPKDYSIATVLQEIMNQLTIMNTTNMPNLALLSSRITLSPNPESIPLNAPLNTPMLVPRYL